jgi:hypothetical protein
MSSVGTVESGHAVWYSLNPADGDRRSCVLTGVVLLAMKGDGRPWDRETYTFCVGLPDIPDGTGFRLKEWAPYVA